MTIMALIISMLSGCLDWVQGPRGFHIECRQIGDNMYSCDGGRL